MKITEETMKQQQEPAASQSDSTGSSASSGTSTGTPVLTEREKLKQMNRSDKLWYIWSYYKLHICGVLLALFFAIGIGNTVYKNSFTTELHCIFLNNYAETELNAAPLEQDFAAYLNLGSKQKITSETSFISLNDTTEFSYASMAKISALLAARELDVIIGDTALLDHYASMGAFLDLEAELPTDTLALVQDRLHYAAREDGSTYACAIDLSDTAFAADSNLAQNPPLLGIIVSSERTDTAKRLISYIFAQ